MRGKSRWPVLRLVRAKGFWTPGHVRMGPATIQDETETYVPEVEVLTSLRSEETVALVAARLEEINGESTSEAERQDLARKILHGLTSPRVVFPSDETSENTS
jgi:hypothetical protein